MRKPTPVSSSNLASRMRSGLARGTSILVSAAFLAGCNRGANPAAGPAVVVGQPGGEVAAVKETLQKISQEKSVAGIAPYLSNRSAAAMGLVLMIPLALVTAFADMGDQFAKSMNKGVGGTGTQPDADKSAKELKALKTDLEAVLKKYGVDSKSQPGQSDTKKLETQGRAFLADMGALVDKLSKSEMAKGKDVSMKPSEMVKKVDELDYQVVSPTEVKLIPKDKKDTTQAKAIVEDGAWRLDFGGVDEMTKQMSAGMKAGASGAKP